MQSIRRIILALTCSILAPLIIYTALPVAAKRTSATVSNTATERARKPDGQAELPVVDSAEIIPPKPLEIRRELAAVSQSEIKAASGGMRQALTKPNSSSASIMHPIPSRPSRPAGTNKSAAVTPDKITHRSVVIGSYTQADLYWLAKMICAEADAEPYAGQVAVGDVILHRVASPDYPDTVKSVVFQVIDGHYQFTPVLTGFINQVEPNSTSYRAARDALNGVDTSKGAMLYYNPATSTNKWILSQPVTVVIGHHVFAK